jgi:hypothetical protein
MRALTMVVAVDSQSWGPAIPHFWWLAIDLHGTPRDFTGSFDSKWWSERSKSVQDNPNPTECAAMALPAAEMQTTPNLKELFDSSKSDF